MVKPNADFAAVVDERDAILAEQSSAVALAKAGMREAAAQLSDYASTDLDLGWDIAGAIRALPDAAADEALARFKADAVREARLEEVRNGTHASWCPQIVFPSEECICWKRERLAALQPASGEKP